MTLQPLPQFTDTYEGSKLRYLVQILQNSFNNLSSLFALLNTSPYSQSSYAQTGNVGATETILASITVAENYIEQYGGSITVQAFGYFASNSNAKELKLYLNETVIYDMGSVAVNGGGWNIQASIINTAPMMQVDSVTMSSGDNALNGNFFIASSEDLTQGATINLTGTGVADNDIVCCSMIVTARSV